MKSMIAIAATAAVAGIASADTLVVPVNVEWPTSQTGLITTVSFALPDVASIDSISIDMAHTWGADLIVGIAGDTNGAIFDLLNENASSTSGNYDLGLVGGDGSLGNVAPYEFVEVGTPVGSIGAGDFLGGLSGLQANAWTGGALAADTYTLSISDTAGGDGGAIGELTITYTIPAPGAMALLGLAGLAGTRRRRA
ncbi:MAG: hypothetical protein ACYTEV_11075 [Planctomycetota bacterium]|jgi:hypothetical protein